jgi:hypothetical protein
MEMARFPAVAQEGQLDRFKRMCGYLKELSSAASRVLSDTPDFAELFDHEYDWCHSVYGYVEEVLP